MMLLELDILGDEARQFDWDVNVLIRWTLDRGMKSLSDEAHAELAKLAEYRKLPNADHERLSDEYVDILETNNQQEVFLRNAALVSLTTLLNVTIRRMLRHCNFKPRKNGRYDGKHEFARFWTEFRERFEIEFSADEIAFVEPMVMARHQIIHEAGDAALILPDGNLDTSFADSYPEYVRHAGTINASVEVCTELLEKVMDKSIILVRACAERLKLAAMAARGDEPEFPMTFGTRVLERNAAKEEGQQPRESDEQR